MVTLHIVDIKVVTRFIFSTDVRVEIEGAIGKIEGTILSFYYVF